MRLTIPEKLLRGRSNVLDDLEEQEGSDIASAVYRNGRATAVRVSELLVRTSLSDLLETHVPENRDDLA